MTTTITSSAGHYQLTKATFNGFEDACFPHSCEVVTFVYGPVCRDRS